MSNDLTPFSGNDGFGRERTFSAGRIRNYLKWTDAKKWRDRDDLTPPRALRVIAIDEFYRSWKDNKKTEIRDKPMPDLEVLNSSIPREEWEDGIDGKPRPPWEHTYGVYLVNPATGETYSYETATTGGKIAYEALDEDVAVTRSLRGSRVLPLVGLSEKPFKTAFGMRSRPHFEILGWKTPGGDPEPSTPQISGPTTPAADTPPAAAAPPTAPVEPTPKPAVKLAAETLNTMPNVKPVSVSEAIDDETPW